MCTMVHMQGSENSLWDLVISFHHVDTEDQT